MKKNIILMTLMAAALSGGVYAVETTAESTAKWAVTVSNDPSATFVVNPAGSINFKFDPSSKQFAQQDAAYTVFVKGDTGSTALQIDAELASDTLNGVTGSATAAGSTADVVLSLPDGSGTELSTSPTTIYTSANTNGDLSGLGNGATDQNAASKFYANLKNFKNNGASATPTNWAAGTYQGEVGVKFVAKWTKA
jgi:Fimbrillin MatB